jgi:hypothetical protein
VQPLTAADAARADGISAALYEETLDCACIDQARYGLLGPRCARCDSVLSLVTAIEVWADLWKEDDDGHEEE